MQNFDGEKHTSDITVKLIKLILNMSESEQMTLMGNLGNGLYEHKRKKTRATYPIDVNYSTEDNEFRDFIQDISVSGVFIKTNKLRESTESLSVGQEVSMKIPYSEHQKNLKIKGKIVRMTPEGIGVEFNK